jgi:plasmid maintenance system antidote protein VapI
MPDARYRLISGEVLTRLMRSHETGLTVHTLAAASGLSASKIRKLIKGLRPSVTSRQADRIAEAVGVTRAALFAPTQSAYADGNRRGRRSMTPEERQARAELGAHTSWAKTTDRTARTAKARKAATARFERQARELHPEASEEHITRVAKHLQKAHQARMTLASVKARRAKAKSKAADRAA